MPVIVAAGTSYLTFRTALASRETKRLELDTGVKTRMIELALDIVKTEPRRDSGNKELRGWATNVIDHFSDVKLGPGAKRALIEQSLFGESVAVQRLIDTPLSRLITDVMRRYAVADIALLNAGAVRSNWLPSIDKIRDDDIGRLLPFGNRVGAVRLQGKDVRKLLDLGARAYGAGSGRLLQVSGLVYGVAPGGPEIDRVCDVRIVEIDGRLTPLQPEKAYTVAISDYLLYSSRADLGAEADKILRDAPVVIQPSEGGLLSDLVRNRIQRREFPDTLRFGRVSVGCLPS